MHCLDHLPADAFLSSIQLTHQATLLVHATPVAPSQQPPTQSPLQQAVMEDDLAGLKTLLMQHPCAANDTAQSGWSIFHLTVFYGHQGIFLFLLSHKADPSLPTRDGWTPLALAVWQRHFALVSTLLGLVDVNQRTPQKGTALHVAAKADDEEAVALLLKHPHVQQNVLDASNATPADLAGHATLPLLRPHSLLETFRSSLTRSTFMKNAPRRPPLIKGHAYKVNYFKMALSLVYLIIDPESGVMARFKSRSHSPLNPDKLIPLDAITDIRNANDLWFMQQPYHYLEIEYNEKKFFLAVKSKKNAVQWRESIRNSVGYHRFVNLKIQEYEERNDEKRIIEMMMQHANEEIVIDEVETEEKGESKGEIEAAGQVAPTQIKEFQFIQEVGRGSFGSVFKVVFRNEVYALKQFDKTSLIDKNRVEYALNDSQLLRGLSHPFLVKMHAAF